MWKAFSFSVPLISLSARLLLADSDVRRADLLCKHLSAQGFYTSHCQDSLALQAQINSTDPDLLLLCEPLGPLTSHEICQHLRDLGSTLPVLVLSESRHYGARVSALQSGADDVLSVPYALDELVARLHALSRRVRMGRYEIAGGLLSYGDLSVNTDTRQVTRAGQGIKLSVKEYDLLLCLLRHQMQILPRDRLLHLVWGDTWVGDDNLLDVYIRYLRKKIERPDLQPLIHTVRGVGFVLK